ncbi:MAG TPA: hypothetical protein VNW29_00875 [Candidatus Sulfotelmatobacter sp.]|jgi:hypothetical protein|nr:hypothetical protein [Candidatus Sulfotelmatobacter sp.]
MSDTAQVYQKLLTDAIRKQMTILGSQITLVKARNVKGITVADDGTAGFLSENIEEIVTNFLEEFRDLSAPLVKKTMQPLLSALGTSTTFTPTLKAKQEAEKNKIEQVSKNVTSNL